MSASGETRKTPLHGAHVAAGGRMVDFAGWNMPVQYSGVIDEHIAVRERVGLFDVSHMGEAIVRGRQAEDFLQYVTCNDVGRLRAGRAHYNALMRPEGTFVDDLLVYRLDDTEFLLVLNAANTAKDLAWLHEHATRFEADVVDASDDWAQLSLQGPRAVELVDRFAEPRPSELRYYAHRTTRVDGVECLVSRTGYTGEDGFEIYAPARQAEALWNRFLEAGRSLGIAAVGLGARDTLRLEAKMALYGNDIDETTTVYEADLGWIVKLGKGEFLGRDVLERQKREGVRRKLVGFEMRGRAIPRHGYVAARGGREIGRVTSGTFAPYLKKRIGLAYLPVEHGAEGTDFEVLVRGRPEPARVVPTPFYKRER